MKSQHRSLIPYLICNIKNPRQRSRAEEFLNRVVVDEPVNVACFRFWKWAVIVWVLACATLIFFWLPWIKPVLSVSEVDVGGVLAIPTYQPVPMDGLSERQQQLLGLPSEDKFVLKHQLHLSDPDNPAYYAQYVYEYADVHDKLPPDYLETVRSIAPDNAFFLYFAAATAIGDALEWKSVNLPDELPPVEVDGRRIPRPRPATFEITQQQLFDQAKDLLEQAQELPTYRSYFQDDIAEKTRELDRLGERETMATLMRSAMLTFDSVGKELAVQRVAKGISAAAEQAAQSGDKEEFLKWVQAREHLLMLISENTDKSLIGSLIYKACAASAVNFQHYSKQIGMGALTARFTRQVDSLYEAKVRESHGIAAPDAGALQAQHGILHTVGMPALRRRVEQPPELVADDLKPLREAEHDLAARVAATAVASLLFLVAGIMAVFRQCLPVFIRKPASQALGLLRVRDWVGIMVYGALMPVCLHLLLVRYTPLGGRDYGIQHFGYAYPGVLFCGLLAVLLFAPVLLVRRRLCHQLPPVNDVSAPSRVAVVLLTLVVLAMPIGYPLLSPFVRAKGMVGSEPWTLFLASFPVAMLLIGATWALVTSIRGKSFARLQLAATTSVLLLCLPVAIVALSLTTTIYKAGEIHWLSRDKTMRIDPDAPDFGLYEMKVAKQIYRDVDVMLGFNDD